MNKIYSLLLLSLTFLFSCKKNDNETPSLKTVVVRLSYPDSLPMTINKQNVTVLLSSSGTSYSANTDNNGVASLSVPVGIYQASAADTASNGGKAYYFNGLKTGLTVTSNWVSTDTLILSLTKSETAQIIIKEIYAGGVQKDDGSGIFQFDSYVTLYNNSSSIAYLGNMCLAMIAPYNAQAANNYYGTDGKLRYEAEKWIPAAQAFWYFQGNVSIDPGKQIVIALNNAVNNTLTYSKSINFDNSAYYATYDIAHFANATYYVSPAASIPSSHYLLAAIYGTGNAWAMSKTSPGLFLFTPDGTTPAAFAADASKTDIQNAYTSKKVPVDWITDGADVFLLNNASNQKRFTSAIDAGYVYHLNGYGYSVYRNVDKAATEALSENAGKLVYSYAYGTASIGGTTDVSGIDAEASIKKGARIIYKDTNNSTNDFHLRSHAALRD